MKRFTLLLVFFSILSSGYSQNRERAQQYINELCSDRMAGRGYVDSGDIVAARYLSKRYEMLGLKAYEGGYLQHFDLNVNTIQHTMFFIHGDSLHVDLTPGVDYAVNPNCPHVYAKGELLIISLDQLLSKKGRKKVKKEFGNRSIPVLPIYDPKNQQHLEAIAELKDCIESNIWIQLKENLVWSVGRTQEESAEIWLKPGALTKGTAHIKVNAKFIQDYTSQNVVGFIPGSARPDSFIVLCGHYDHLGKMGDAVYAGANDNASGIAMMLDLADHFWKDRQRYSIVVIAFGGEEAGLVGSRYFVENPIIPLDKIRFVFNMDLMGNGEDGATIVNASVFTDDFKLLESINLSKQYLDPLKKRGKAANSDHYFFSEAGIPSFFMYTMGAYTHYHIPEDNAENLKLHASYDQCFLLISDFIEAINH